MGAREDFIAKYNEYEKSNPKEEKIFQEACKILPNVIDNLSVQDNNVDSLSKAILKDKDLNKILVQSQFGAIMLQDYSVDLQASVNFNNIALKFEAEKLMVKAIEKKDSGLAAQSLEKYREISLSDKQIAAILFDLPKGDEALNLVVGDDIKNAYQNIRQDNDRLKGDFLSMEQTIAKKNFIGLYELSEQNKDAPTISQLEEKLKKIEGYKVTLTDQLKKIKLMNLNKSLVVINKRRRAEKQ